MIPLPRRVPLIAVLLLVLLPDVELLDFPYRISTKKREVDSRFSNGRVPGFTAGQQTDEQLMPCLLHRTQI